MKTLFIPAKINIEINKEKIKSLTTSLPKNIAIAYSIQYKNIAEQIKSILPINITQITQVLGCSKPKFSKSTEAILLIGSGGFHALSLALETKLPIYILEKDKLTKISKREIEQYEKQKKATYLKFLHADRVGIFISTKPGQENLKRAINLMNKIKNKTFYLFFGDNFNSAELENFPIQSWVNTACPRLDMDFSVMNISDLEEKR